MSRVVVTNHLTLDGVMQSPADPDEDRRGGFEHGGWAAHDNDEVMARKMGEGMAQGGPLLLGRKTYERVHGGEAARRRGAHDRRPVRRGQGAHRRDLDHRGA